jgi:hypothetical protein
VRRRIVARHAEHDDAELLERRPVVAEAAGLLRAAGRVVLRVEVDDDVLAGEVGERDLLAVLIGERERGSLLAFDDGHEACPFHSRRVRSRHPRVSLYARRASRIRRA